MRQPIFYSGFMAGYGSDITNVDCSSQLWDCEMAGHSDFERLQTAGPNLSRNRNKTTFLLATSLGTTTVYGLLGVNLVCSSVTIPTVVQTQIQDPTHPGSREPSQNWRSNSFILHTSNDYLLAGYSTNKIGNEVEAKRALSVDDEA